MSHPDDLALISRKSPMHSSTVNSERYVGMWEAIRDLVYQFLPDRRA
jgi:hypothetical protein